MTVYLRPGQPTDAGKIGDILDAFVTETPWLPRIYSAAELMSFCGQMIDDGWITVAVLEDRVQGFIARDGTDIVALYVARSANRRGLGRMLLDDAKARCDTLKLWTFLPNTSAQQFYLREGFSETGRGDGSDTDEKLPDIAYQWQAKGQAAVPADQTKPKTTPIHAQKTKPNVPDKPDTEPTQKESGR